jgi:hypothetical protein
MVLKNTIVFFCQEVFGYMVKKNSVSIPWFCRYHDTFGVF